jgi:RsiW-degrading membrane proteinase PrsW (M82 family)
LTAFDSRFITPPKEEEEIYPYRRVWSSIVAEAGLMVAIAAIIFLATRFVDVPRRFYLPIGIGISIIPVGLWLGLSWWPERFVPQPRTKLILVAIISALAANAIGIPLVENFLQVDKWLPLESAINRIIGYTFTQGLVQAVITYLVVRYLVWPDNFRTRLDSIAYGAACAVGYATVLNLHFVLSANPSPATAAFRVFDALAVQLAINIIIGYGLSEVRFNGRVFPALLVATIALASFITGLAIPLRSGLTNAALEQGVGSASPIRGFLLSAALLAAVSFVFAFLFDNAERQDAEAAAQRE